KFGITGFLIAFALSFLTKLIQHLDETGFSNLIAAFDFPYLDSIEAL
ncbi:10031_t:CDS:2, partial [Gigaspora margarita]